MKAKMRAGAEMETEELVELIRLVGCEVLVRRKKTPSRRQKAKKNSHPLVFLNRLYESYQTTGCIFRIQEISGDFSTIPLPIYTPRRPRPPIS